MNNLTLFIFSALVVMTFSQTSYAHGVERGLEKQDKVQEVIHGDPALVGELAHRYDEEKIPAADDIDMMKTPEKVEKGDAEKVGIH